MITITVVNQALQNLIKLMSAFPRSTMNKDSPHKSVDHTTLVLLNSSTEFLQVL